MSPFRACGVPSSTSSETQLLVLQGEWPWPLLQAPVPWSPASGLRSGTGGDSQHCPAGAWGVLGPTTGPQFPPPPVISSGQAGVWQDRTENARGRGAEARGSLSCLVPPSIPSWGRGHTTGMVPGAGRTSEVQQTRPRPEGQPQGRTPPFAAASHSGRTSSVFSFPRSELSFLALNALPWSSPVPPARTHCPFPPPTPGSRLHPGSESVPRTPELLLPWCPALFCWNASLCDSLEWPSDSAPALAFAGWMVGRPAPVSGKPLPRKRLEAPSAPAASRGFWEVPGDGPCSRISPPPPISLVPALNSAWVSRAPACPSRGRSISCVCPTFWMILGLVFEGFGVFFFSFVLSIRISSLRAPSSLS